MIMFRSSYFSRLELEVQHLPNLQCSSAFFGKERNKVQGCSKINSYVTLHADVSLWSVVSSFSEVNIK